MWAREDKNRNEEQRHSIKAEVAVGTAMLCHSLWLRFFFVCVAFSDAATIVDGFFYCNIVEDGILERSNSVELRLTDSGSLHCDPKQQHPHQRHTNQSMAIWQYKNIAIPTST